MSEKTAKTRIADETFILLPEKAAIWEKYHWLLLADLHLGKVSHFRKNGMAITPEAADADLANLKMLIEKYLPKKVIFLGDLFHSHHNREWERLMEMIRSLPDIEWVLIRGNHDILDQDKYRGKNFELLDHLEQDGIILTHEPVDSKSYNLHGHIHPGVRMSGKARQSITLPCFWFGKTHGIFPAFGSLTGLYIIKPAQGDRVFPIIPSQGFVDIKS